MVITDANQVMYQGDGVNTAWPFTFAVSDASEIRVQLNNTDGTAVLIDSDFYVDAVTNTVYYPGYAPGAEPAEADQPPKVQTGQTITVYREVPMTQEADLGDKWPFHVIEGALDKLTMICQQIYGYTNRKLDAALASMFQLAGIVTDSGKLQHITDQYNAIDANAAAAAESEENAAASAEAAANSASSASASNTSATNTANALVNFLESKETLTAPAVDPTLTISGAAADSKVVGDAFDLVTIKKDVDSAFDSVENGTVYSSTNPSGTSWSGGRSFIKGVSANERYKITTTILQQTFYYAVLLYDDTTYIGGVYQGTSSATSIVDYEFSIPTGVNRIIVTTYTSVTPVLKQVVMEAKVDDTLTIAGVPADAKATGDAINVVGESLGTAYYSLTPVSVINGAKASYSTNNNGFVFITASPSQRLKIYKVKAGKYKIKSYGYDVHGFDVALTADVLLTGTNQSTPCSQLFLCGGSTYPADYKYHLLDVDVQSDGYLYLNEYINLTKVAFCAEKRQSFFPKNGLLVSNNIYYHFVKIADDGKCLIRRFNRRGPNNLLQLTSVGLGYFILGTETIVIIENELTKDISTDIIGPVSMYPWGQTANGLWAGGNHSVNVGGTEYPTAEETDLKVYVDGTEITTDGMYYGDAKIVATNAIYFAQTITDGEFTDAVQAWTEKRTYILADTMKVQVELEALSDISVVLYYGMQYVNTNVQSAVVPNDDYILKTIPPSTTYYFSNPQSDVILNYANNVRLHMLLDQAGLGSYGYNDGQTSYKYGNIATFGKTYYALITQKKVGANSYLYWSGEYRYDV